MLANQKGPGRCPVPAGAEEVAASAAATGRNVLRAPVGLLTKVFIPVVGALSMIESAPPVPLKVDRTEAERP